MEDARICKIEEIDGEKTYYYLREYGKGSYSLILALCVEILASRYYIRGAIVPTLRQYHYASRSFDPCTWEGTD